MTKTLWARLLLALLVGFSPMSGAVSRDAAAQFSSGGYVQVRSGGSSGGYSAPSRRPSVSSSGGYSRPGAGFGAPSSGASVSESGGDRAVSRRTSSDALTQYRTPPPAAAQAPQSAPSASSYGSGAGGYDDTSRRPSVWGNGSYGGGYAPGYAPTYAPPPPSYGWAQPGRSFGVWDGLMLWGLLNAVSNNHDRDSARFFYNNQTSPAYQQWRAETERSAQQDPAIRARLDDLDRQMAQLQGQPQQAGSPPPSGKPPPLGDTTRPASAQPVAARTGGGRSWLLLVLLLALVGVVVGLWLWRRKMASAGAGSASGPEIPAALRGSDSTRFRVGMTFPVDPSPFLLAGPSAKIKPIDASGMISVEAVGVQMDGDIPLNRLYLPGSESFFLLHLGADGKPDECRYFSRLDEIAPASNEEWGAWLDPAQGMIGWPQFQTKDGKTYDRVWAPGGTRIAPREMTETVQTLSGTTTRKLSSMLYGAPTGLAEPAPQTEYILVSAVDAPGQAFVEIHAGIDINPAALTLPAVKFN